jgi:sulfur relay (sulfurtransferase) DsrF/TusC family protein
MIENTTNAEYLGDGLYALINENQQVELRANDFTNPTDTVYLEYNTLKCFVAFLLKYRLI